MDPLRLFALFALVACAACGRWGFGDRSSDRDDVGPGDDGVVTLEIITAAGPLQGIPVVFHNADGEVVGEGVSDADGLVWGWIPPNGMVTIPDAGGNNYITRARNYAARTIMGLNPGDQLTIGSVIDPWASSHTFDVTLSEEFLGADSYRLSAGCNSDSISAWTGTLVLDVGAECTRGGASTLTLVGYALDVDGNVLATTVLEGVAMDSAGEVMGAWQTPTAVAATLDVVNTPAYADDVDGKIYSLLDTMAYFSDSSSAGSVGSGGASLAINLIEERVDARRIHVQVDFDDPNDPDAPDSILYYRAKRSDTSTAIEVDFADMDLPIIRSVNLDTTGARPSFAIDAEGNNFDGTDHRFTVVEWLTADDYEYEWLFMHPPDMDSFEMPEMPKEFENYLVTADDEILSLQTAAFDYDFVQGYADMVSSFAFELFAWEFWLVPTDDWSWRASAGPDGFRGL